MADRTKVPWVPGLVTLILSVACDRALSGVIGWAGARNFGPVDLYFNLPHLLAFAFIGAIGAYWSRRAGGGSRDRLLAALTPVLWPLAVFVMVATKDAVVGRSLSWALFTSAFLDGTVIPGVALFIGALPFLRAGSK